MMRLQKLYNDKIIPDITSEEAKDRLTQNLALCTHAEISALVNAVNFKHHHSVSQKINRDNILFESVDIIRYIMAIMNVWDIDPLEFINTPYLWGGKTKYGIDCSGLIQVIMRTKKRFIPRDAKDQANFGETVKFDLIKKNDLCFFGKNVQNITHVGLYIGKNKLLHAFEKVRIDEINKKGIFNSDSLKITHNLISIRRIN